MKHKILSALFLGLFSSTVFSQVIIGDAAGTATDKTSVLLEFANTNNKGIALPAVRTLPTNPTPGTLLLDASTPTDARVKYYNGEWIDLTGENIRYYIDIQPKADITSFLADQPTGITEKGGVIIGSHTSDADGVLVLESKDKAMVLPIVVDYSFIQNPTPGMMALQTYETVKEIYHDLPEYRLIIFNGKTWTFWEADN
ncbi:MAG: hypothetical protein Q4G16_06335 [Cruoricaptor ignavus]|nr:hypothetical protein [Cruoricaptor ignavus]